MIIKNNNIIISRYPLPFNILTVLFKGYFLDGENEPESFLFD